MSTWKHIATVSIVICGLSITAMSLAQSTREKKQTPPKSDDMHNYVCKDVMRTSGEELAISAGLGVHGVFVNRIRRRRESTPNAGS